MKNKRAILVDKKYQLRMAASLTAAAALALTVFIVIIVIVSRDYSRKLDVVVTNQRSLSENQNEIFRSLLALSKHKNFDNIRISPEDIEKDISLNMSKLDETISITANISSGNYRLIVILIVFLFAQSIILFYLIIRRSHRTSGPVFILNRYISEIQNGKFPEIRPLRPKDDFTQLFDNFRGMVDYLKKKNG